MPLTSASAPPMRCILLDHWQHPGRGAAVQRPGHRADRTGQRRANVGAGRCDHPGGEGGGVHPVLGSGDPVGVDGLDVLGIGFYLPAGHKWCGHRGTFVDPALRHRRLVNPARGLRDVGQRHHRRARHLLTRGLVVDVQQRPIAQIGASMATPACTSTRTSPLCTGSGNGRWGQSLAELACPPVTPIHLRTPPSARPDPGCPRRDSAVRRCLGRVR